MGLSLTDRCGPRPLPSGPHSTVSQQCVVWLLCSFCLFSALFVVVAWGPEQRPDADLPGSLPRGALMQGPDPALPANLLPCGCCRGAGGPTTPCWDLGSQWGVRMPGPAWVPWGRAPTLSGRRQQSICSEGHLEAGWKRSGGNYLI